MTRVYFTTLAIQAIAIMALSACATEHSAPPIDWDSVSGYGNTHVSSDTQTYDYTNR